MALSVKSSLGGGGFKFNNTEDIECDAFGGIVKGDFCNVFSGFMEGRSLVTPVATVSGVHSVIKLSEGKIFILYTEGVNVKCMICLYDDANKNVTTHSIGTLDSAPNSMSISATKVSDTKVFVCAYEGSTMGSKSIVCWVCNIDGTNVNTGSSYKNTTTATTGSISGCSCEYLDSNRVYIVYIVNGAIYHLIASIDNTSISFSAESLVDNNKARAPIRTVKLSNGNVFVCFPIYNSYYYLYAFACSINGTTITKDSITNIGRTNRSGQYVSCSLLSNGNIGVAYSLETYRCTDVISVSGTTVSVSKRGAYSDEVGYNYNITTSTVDAGLVTLAANGNSSGDTKTYSLHDNAVNLKYRNYFEGSNAYAHTFKICGIDDKRLLCVDFYNGIATINDIYATDKGAIKTSTNISGITVSNVSQGKINVTIPL